MNLSAAELKDFLEAKHDAYNRPDFIPLDPVSIPHRFSLKEDIEIAGFFAATFAWGRRDLIIRAANQVCARMGESPFDFVMQAGDAHLQELEGFVYRTFQGIDAQGLVRTLRNAYTQHNGLEQVLAPRPGESNTMAAILRFRALALATPGFQGRTQKHIADPSAGSSAKRLNMYLRWMVRRDNRGVDFGLWTKAQPAQLICPLDVHTGTSARKLGMLSRKQDDWRSAVELTDVLRSFDPEDPVKYDFSLFGLGISEGF